MMQGAVDGHGGSSSIMGSRCAYAAQSGLLLGGVSSHLNARNQTGVALATEEFVALFQSANWTSRQAERPDATICHNFLQEGKVMVNMIEYNKSIIADFPEEIVATRRTPAADHLFTVRDESLSNPLPEEQARAFHHASAQLLFLSARVRRDIQPATAFLTTRVRCPDKDSWGKVKRVLGYLKGTLNMPLILSADSLTLSR